MSGKSYARGMRGHKLTLQAMWRLLVPKLLAFIQDTDQDLDQQIQDDLSTDNTEGLSNLFASADFKKAMDAFVSSNENPNFQFWWTYMNMVQILLLHQSTWRRSLATTSAYFPANAAILHVVQPPQLCQMGLRLPE